METLICTICGEFVEEGEIHEDHVGRIVHENCGDIRVFTINEVSDIVNDYIEQRRKTERYGTIIENIREMFGEDV